jgi:hypothetical protein
VDNRLQGGDQADGQLLRSASGQLAFGLHARKPGGDQFFPGLEESARRGELEDVRQWHITVTSYCRCWTASSRRTLGTLRWSPLAIPWDWTKSWRNAFGAIGM